MRSSAVPDWSTTVNRQYSCSDLELSVLSLPTCPNRIECPPGPLVCYWVDLPSQRSIVDVRDLLLLPDERGRIAALEYFLRLAEDAPVVISPVTRAVLSRVASSMCSHEPSQWRRSALELHDAMIADFFVSLSAFDQCKSIGYQQGANSFAEILLRPSLKMVDTIPMEVLIPTADRDKIQGVIDHCRETTPELEEALDAFFTQIGHLPLDYSLGIGRVVERWANSLPEGSLWERAWTWADQTRSPLARYHLCLLFLERPALISDCKRDAFRNELNEIIRGVHGERKDEVWSPAWRVRCDLARHYTQYFECRTPGFESERVANLAWWLAERVGNTFGDHPDYLEQVHSRVVLPAYWSSNQGWELLRPTLQPSSLRYATIHVPSCWSLSLLCQIGQLASAEIANDPASGFGSVFRRDLITALLASFPPPSESIGPVTYAFDRGLNQAAESQVQRFGRRGGSRSFSSRLHRLPCQHIAR